MSNDTNTVLLKVAAAQRQIDAAIRMHFSGEDKLAVFTVAAAAHRILRDLLEKRGRSAAGEIIRDARRMVAYQLEAQFLQEGVHLPDDVVEAAIRLNDNRISADVSAHGARFDRAIWRGFNESANFLKHADRDADATIEAAKIDVEPVLTAAIVNYAHLMVEPTVEMSIYLIALHIQHRNSPLADDLERLRLKMLRVPAGRRGKASLQLIAELKRRQRPIATPHSS